jgi:mono/diheme cytochrome c family protein
MSARHFVLITAFLTSAIPAMAADPAGNADAGRQFFTRSCTSCHAMNATTTAADTAPPLSYIAKDIKQRPAWIRGWLMDPHPPMPGIMLSRQQVNDVIAYLNSLTAE